MLEAEQIVIDENRRIRAEGRAEGRLSGRIEDAKNMLKEKIDINIIEKVTSLKREQFK